MKKRMIIVLTLVYSGAILASIVPAICGGIKSQIFLGVNILLFTLGFIVGGEKFLDWLNKTIEDL